MKRIIFIYILFSAFTSLSQANEVTEVSRNIVINFTKNDSGEIVVRVNGHSQPLEIQFNGTKTGTLYVEDSSVNLSQLGFESSFIALDTASGSSGVKADAQAIIPPVSFSVNPNPPLTTPF